MDGAKRWTGVLLVALGASAPRVDARVATEPTPQSLAGSSTESLRRVLGERDAEATLAWYDTHRSAAFHRTETILRDLIASRAEPDRVDFRDHEADVRFLNQVLEGHELADLVATVLSWSVDECASFVTLEQELEERSASADLPAPDAIAELRAASSELGGAALLVRPWSRWVPVLHSGGRSEEALAIVSWIRDLSKEAGNPWTLAWSLEWQAQDAWRRGALREASRLLTQAVDLDRQLGDSPHRAQLLCDLASVHIGLGDITGGLVHAERAETLARELDDSVSLRRAVEVRAGLHFELGEHQAALELCTSLVPADAAQAPRDLAQLHVYLTAANILSDVGRVESATAFARRALELASLPDIADEAPGARAQVLLTLGLLLGDGGDAQRALEMLEEARVEFQREADWVGVAWAEKNTGWVRLARGELRAAATHLGRAWQTATDSDLSYLEGLTALGVAEALEALPDRTAGETERLQRALAVATRQGTDLPDLQLAWRAATVEGRLAARSGQLATAYAHFERAVDLVERWRKRLQTPGLLAHALRNKADPYREAAFTAARLGRIEDTLRMTELLRARVLVEARGRKQGPLASADPEPLQRARRRVVQAEHALRAAPGGAEDRTARLEALHAAEAELDNALLVSELAGRPGQHEANRSRVADRVAPIRGAAPITPSRLKACLEGADVDQVFSFLPAREGTLAFVADASRVHVQVLPVGAERLSEWVGRLRGPLEALRRGELDLAHLAFDDRAARALGDALFEPLRAAGHPPLPRALVLADGVLCSLPFELLVVSGKPGPVDPARPFEHLRSLDFLAEQVSISYGTSLASLRRTAREASFETPASPTVTALVAPSNLGVASAAAEVDALRRAFGAGLHVVEDAAPEDLARAAVRGSRFLHLLAHGQSDAVFPAQGFVLLGSRRGARSGSSSPSRLEAWQVEEIALDTELTVLSACHSGEGAWATGEGLLGLTRSFLAAGSRRVIASRWAVEDRASAAMMGRLYRGLAAGLSPSDALQEARLALMAGDDPRGFALVHPYFWAGWVVHR